MKAHTFGTRAEADTPHRRRSNLVITWSTVVLVFYRGKQKERKTDRQRTNKRRKDKRKS